MIVHILDRVLDGNDMTTAVAVAIVDKCSQRGRFTGAGSTNEQDQAALAHHHIGKNFRQAQVLPIGNFSDDVTRYYGHFIALQKNIHPKSPEAGNRHGKVHFQLLLKFSSLGFIHYFVGDLLDIAGFHNLTVDRLQLPLKLGTRRRTGTEIKIGPVLGCQGFEPVCYTQNNLSLIMPPHGQLRRREPE